MNLTTHFPVRVVSLLIDLHLVYLFLKDWDYLIKSSHHKFFCEANGSISGLKIVADKCDPASECDSKMASSPVDTSAVLFPFLNYVLYALHVVYEVRRIANDFLFKVVIGGV